MLSTQRVNRAALPHLRKQKKGLVVWVGSTSTRGGTPPYLAPYFAAKAAMDALAVSYAAELNRWGIETSIIVPGPSPPAPTTSRMLVCRLTRHVRLNTTVALTRASAMTS